MTDPPRRTHRLRAAGIGLLLIVLALVLVVLLATVVPTLLVPDTTIPNPVELIKARNDVRSSLLGALGGLGALAALYFTWAQLGITRRQAQQNTDDAAAQQLNERLAKSTEMLGHPTDSVRIASIANLELLADQHPDKRPIIAQVLVALVRQMVPLPDGPDTTPDTTSGQFPALANRSPTAEWALVALGRTVVDGDWPKRLRLNSLDLTGANLEGLNLAHADLAHTRLDHAYLRDTNLTNAWMPHTSLRHADFRDAHVTGAVIRSADLAGAVGLDQHRFHSMIIDNHTAPPNPAP